MVVVTNPPNVNLSQIVVDAGLDLSGGDYDILLKAARTVDGKDVSTLGDMDKTIYDKDKDNIIDTFKLWDVSTAVYLQLISVAAKEINPRGLFFKPDGIKMYVTGLDGDDVNEYDLSTPWDVSTAVYLQAFSVAGEETEPQELFFNPAGTKMYVIGSIGDDVNEYDLSTPWDVSTAVYLQVFSVAGEEIEPSGLFFKPGGAKMYIIGSNGDEVNEYDLSTPWDVSTASHLQLFSVAGEETTPQSLSFNPAGTKMYVMGIDGDDVNEYDLSTPWDVSTAVYLQAFSVATQEITPQSLFFKPDGTKMYVMGNGGDDVNEYIIGRFGLNE